MVGFWDGAVTRAGAVVGFVASKTKLKVRTFCVLVYVLLAARFPV